MAYINEIVVNGQAVKYNINGLVDKSSKARFTALNGLGLYLEGFTPSYAAIDLNGRELNIVLAGELDPNTAIISSQQMAAIYNITKETTGDYNWLLDKIYPVANVVCQGTVLVMSDKTDWTSAEIGTALLLKDFQGKPLSLMTLKAVTAGANGGYIRLEFHLVIDDEN